MDFEYQNNVAKVSWNDPEGRFEMHILNKLKAHTVGETPEEHEQAKPDLIKLAKDKGYAVIEA